MVSGYKSLSFSSIESARAAATKINQDFPRMVVKTNSDVAQPRVFVPQTGLSQHYLDKLSQYVETPADAK